MKVNQYKTAKITAALLYFSYSLSPKVYAEIPFNAESPLQVYSLHAQQKGGNISGRIVNAEGKPLANVRIQLIGVGNTVSDKGGYFKFEGVMYGKYELVISLEGYENITQTIEVNEENYQFVEPLVMQAARHHLDEIVVTASRLAEHIDEVPSSITYIGGKTLDQQRQINDNLPSILMQKVPSISPSEESQNNFIAKIRGRNFLVLIDGIPQSTPLRNGGRDLRTIDASAIDHIEVINGATAMYGNGAAGGVINYITKKPKKGKKLSSSTYLNNSLSLVRPNETYGYNIAQVFSGQIGKWDYVLQGKMGRTGVVRSSDGTVVSPFYGLGETKSYNTLAKIGYQIAPNHHVEVMGNYYRSLQDSKYIGTTGKFGESPAIGIPTNTSINGGTPYNKALHLKYDGQYGKTEANLSLYYEDMNTVFETYNQNYSDHKGARLNFNTPFQLGATSKISLIYGMDLLKDHTVQKTLKDELVTPDMNMNNLAFYVQGKVNIGNDWILKGGIRYENIRFKVGDLTKNGKLTAGENNHSDAFVFNLATRYNKYSYLQPFASFSQGYSIGDVGLILRNGVPLSKIDPKPVVVNNFELGVNGKIDVWDYQLIGYYSTSKKGTTFAETSVPGNYELSQVPQRIYGVEFVANVKPVQWLTVGTVLGYMDGRQDLKNEGNFKDKLDNSIISPFKINLNVDVKLSQQWNVYLQYLHLGGRNVFSPEEYNYGKYPISGYNLVDLQTKYKYQQFTFSFSINNLFNADYYPIHAEVRGATNEGRYYIKGSGTMASLGVQFDL
ncbi:TonB-dependent receptor [Chryseobacterium jejuense]|uniref:Iron complex outermembrane recepter protein n=1 Tax=Chryseobacterium jejuense TaxID=445960 RepID=A0A2X2VHZ2_CHRJE|nr:TonB-dependent receptor [Chryseobacterium jejuense]SDJ14841.1 iron complex outermembrane recepter protein [Chryseobacterium jejuense]SQB28044.1 Iron-regulated outer membrane proteins [Chryseobacterium jejuense]